MTTLHVALIADSEQIESWTGDAIKFAWGIGIATALRCARSDPPPVSY